MNKKNCIMLNSMARLSRIIRNIKEARRNLDFVIDQSNYFIVQGQSTNLIREYLIRRAVLTFVCK